MNKTAPKSNFLKRIQNMSLLYYILPFGVWMSVLAVKVLQSNGFHTEGYYLIHYLYTYKHGFVSRGLFGEIISWFADIVSPLTVKIASVLAAVLFITAASLCMGYALNKTRKEHPENFGFLFCLMVFINVIPFSFRLYIADMKLDKIVWSVALLALLCIANRKTIYFVPLLSVLAILFNPVFVFTSVVIIAIPLLQKLHDEGYSKRMKVLLPLTYAIIVIVALSSAVSEKYLGFETAEEMLNYYFQRYSERDFLTPETMEFYINECIPDFFVSATEYFRIGWEKYFIGWETWKVVLFNSLLYALPLHAVFWAFWGKCMKTAQERFQKFVFLVCILSPFVGFLPSILSWESSKYFANSIFAQLCVLAYFIVTNNPCVMETIDKAKQWVKNNTIVSTIICAYFTLLMVA